MDDKNQEVFRQYSFKIYNTYRIRGAHILETNEGPKLFKHLECSINRVEFEDQIHQHLVNKNHPYVDLYVRNSYDEVVTKDSMGNFYTMKDWYPGEECNLRDEEEVIAGVANLAYLHTLLREVPLDNEIVSYNQETNLVEIFDKRNRELKRVRSYIRGKRKKNEFELCFMSCYDQLLAQALEATELLQSSKYDELLQQTVRKKHICHGNYTYHNIIMLKQNQANDNRSYYTKRAELKAANLNSYPLNQKMVTTNFDKAIVGIQINDLYHFIRKTMEKNEWDLDLGSKMIETYENICGISPNEKQLLYILLLYPEKFWKVSNYYYNGKKSWVPKRNIQKLMDIRDQGDRKNEFLKCLKETIVSH